MILRLSSMATRSAFMPRSSSNEESVRSDAKSRSFPLMWSFMGLFSHVGRAHDGGAQLVFSSGPWSRAPGGAPERRKIAHGELAILTIHQPRVHNEKFTALGRGSGVLLEDEADQIDVAE